MRRSKAKKGGSPEKPETGIASNLRALRQVRGWTQGELAQKVGVHLTQINRVELGRTVPGVDFALRLARALGVTVDALLSPDEGAREVRVEDKDLAERLRLLEGLDREKRDVVIKVIDSMLTEQRMRQLLEQKPGPAQEERAQAR
jgi:transcriptional regulator with XRE-family HTH domain